MKRRDVLKKLRTCGWTFEREGANHEIWTNGELSVPVPRHPEVNEYTAKSILKTAAKNPPKRG